jgi:hypothetical protein
MTVVSCNGGSDGCAIVTASGGPSGNFIYQWSNGGSNDTICGLAAGTYYVTVTDTTGGSSVQNVIVYNETFDPAPGWTLNVPTGVNGTDPNFWVINDNEGGVIPPGCGVASNGNNSLHITSVFFPGGGAAYDAGGLCGILFCPETNMRAESPVINTTGFSNLTLTFDFISMGDALIDNASVWYNDGLGWTQLSPSIKSVNCLSGQGQWTAASFVLPPNTWNIPNLRIGFNWTNNDDGVGTDPSVAINNVLITSTTTLTGNASCSVVDSITVIEPTPVAIAFTRTNSYCGRPLQRVPVAMAVIPMSGTPHLRRQLQRQPGSCLAHIPSPLPTCWVVRRWTASRSNPILHPSFPCLRSPMFPVSKATTALQRRLRRWGRHRLRSVGAPRPCKRALAYPA